jgi:hypothetical protein
MEGVGGVWGKRWWWWLAWLFNNSSGGRVLSQKKLENQPFGLGFGLDMGWGWGSSFLWSYMTLYHDHLEGGDLGVSWYGGRG